jgi:CRISPR-associated protein Cas1
MQPIDTGSLKAVIHSKRANLYYLEHCRVLVQGGRVAYLTDSDKESLYWNIPIANTTCLLLGTGTSLTQAAMRELTRAGVMVWVSAVATARRCSPAPNATPRSAG